MLNECMLLFVTFHKRVDGDPYGPSSWITNLKTIFGYFRDRGVDYNFLKDFNNKGQFIATLPVDWNDTRK